MSRHSGTADDGEHRRISRAAVQHFFESRAERAEILGPTRAVIYQDKHADLAERRDVAERTKLTPLLQLDGSQSLLDVGCGTGRWVESLAPHVADYCGIDTAPGLVRIARERFDHLSNVAFSAVPVDELSLDRLSRTRGFDRVLVVGVLVYLNDDALVDSLARVAKVLGDGPSLALFREPVAVDQRLTLDDHWSEELEQNYSAIYRTRAELCDALSTALAAGGMKLLRSGAVYEDDPSLNNRMETRQEWFLFGDRP